MLPKAKQKILLLMPPKRVNYHVNYLTYAKREQMSKIARSLYSMHYGFWVQK